MDLMKIAAPDSAAGAECIQGASIGLRRHRIVTVCALGTAALGALVLAGWFFKIFWLASLETRFAMAPNTALAFVFAGAALYSNPARHRIAAMRLLSALTA